MTELRNASRRGAPSLELNPPREHASERFATPQDPLEMVTLSSARIASEYCQVSAGSGLAVLKGIMKLVLEAHDTAVRTGADPILDVAFIEQHTHDFSAFARICAAPIGTTFCVCQACRVIRSNGWRQSTLKSNEASRAARPWSRLRFGPIVTGQADRRQARAELRIWITARTQ
jgi:hypothetical protein